MPIVNIYLVDSESLWKVYLSSNTNSLSALAIRRKETINKKSDNTISKLVADFKTQVGETPEKQVLRKQSIIANHVLKYHILGVKMYVYQSI